MGKGKRYSNDTPKLNIKRVILTIVVIAVICCVVMLIKNMFRTEDRKLINDVSVGTTYFTTYLNGKWGVIDNNGKCILDNNYDEMIIIPDKLKALFICPYNVNYQVETYSTKVLNENGNTILTEYSNIKPVEYYNSKEVWYDKDVLIYEVNGKKGLIDYDGDVVLQADYDELYALDGIEKNIIIKKDNKLGLLNTSNGDIIIQPEYDEIKTLVKDSYESGYIVKKNEKYGVISAASKVIFEPIYTSIQQVTYDGYYVVSDGTILKLIESDQTEVLNIQYEKVSEIYDNNLVVSTGNKYGIISIKGEVCVNLEYDSLKHIFDKYYIASKDGKYGIISNDNQQVIEFKYNSMEYIKKADFIEADNANLKTDIINRNFEVVLKDIIVSDLNIEEGYLKVRENSEYKYYNFKFEEKNIHDVLTTSTLFLIKENGKYGYENKNRERIVDCIYDDAREQNKYGYCAVKKNGLWGSLKSDGTVVLNPYLNLDENFYIDFINDWHFDEKLGVYTK